jgi:hypothetical protein
MVNLLVHAVLPSPMNVPERLPLPAAAMREAERRLTRRLPFGAKTLEWVEAMEFAPPQKRESAFRLITPTELG